MSSEELLEGDGAAENAFNGQANSSWHAQWSHNPPAHPHQLVLDLGRNASVQSLRYLPRGDKDQGRIKEFRLYLSDAPFGLEMGK